MASKNEKSSSSKSSKSKSLPKSSSKPPKSASSSSSSTKLMKKVKTVAGRKSTLIRAQDEAVKQQKQQRRSRKDSVNSTSSSASGASSSSSQSSVSAASSSRGLPPPQAPQPIDPVVAFLSQYSKIPVFKLYSATLNTQVCKIDDAAFRRKYLIENRPQEEAHFVGDLVWAKLPDWPWWPAMISVHPQRDEFVKYDKDIGPGEQYHIQYFGPTPFHGWTEASSIRPYEGYSRFLHKMATNIRNASEADRDRIVQSYSVLPEDQEPLHVSISEAEQASKLERLERVKLLTYRYYSEKYQKFFV